MFWDIGEYAKVAIFKILTYKKILLRLLHVFSSTYVNAAKGIQVGHKMLFHLDQGLCSRLLEKRFFSTILSESINLKEINISLKVFLIWKKQISFIHCFPSIECR